MFSNHLKSNQIQKSYKILYLTRQEFYTFAG